jgi:hypothetical protein
MTTLPYRRQQVTPRSGGRIAEGRRNAVQRDNGGTEDYTTYTVSGSAALQPSVERAHPATAERGTPERAAPDRSTASRANPGRLRVAPPVPVTTPRTPFVALVLVVVVTGVLGILVLNTKINENAFKLQALRDKQARLDLQEQQLDQDLALAASPNSLAASARRLGLVPAGTPAFIRLPDGRILGVPQPATGAQSASGGQGATSGQPAGQAGR